MFWFLALIFLRAYKCGFVIAFVIAWIFFNAVGWCVGQTMASSKIKNRFQNIGENCSLGLFISISP